MTWFALQETLLLSVTGVGLLFGLLLGVAFGVWSAVSMWRDG